ncbi:type II toxin-antitoxin system prevent-host-death family antitoxin [Streptomyces sp. NPDC050095]|uniref:type II toxin-antitoxin system Phd/YefM family antitoxin n=1 Tax=unclassified Streptomyces TaxID=2593676 RepID=UPI00342C7F2A
MAPNEAQRQYNVHDAKTHFSRILQLVETGEEVIISRAGQPVAKVVPLHPTVRRTARGSLRSPVVFHDDFDDLSDDDGFAEAFGLREGPA